MTSSENIGNKASSVEHALPFSLFVKKLLIGSRCEPMLLEMRWRRAFMSSYRHPELMDLLLEGRQLPFVVQRLLTTEAHVVDVGAHIGSFVSLIFQYAPGGQHLAFEPSRRKSKWLRKKFPQVEVIASAVADQSGSAYFLEDLRRPGFSHLEFDGEVARARQDDKTRAYEVPVCRLDDILLDRRVDLIKLDIEGGELRALKGAKEAIARWQPSIIFECGPTYALQEVGVDRATFFEFFTAELGYKLYTFSDFLFRKGSLGPEEFRKAGIYPFRAFNLIALPQSKEIPIETNFARRQLDFRGV